MASGKSNMAMVADSKPSFEYREMPIPKPGSGEVLVEISHVAQNPTDILQFDRIAWGDDTIYGCDFVGKVVEVGDDVSKLKVGDHVAALIWGGEQKKIGAYAHYTIADQNIAFKIPAGIDPASASTIPLAATTAWLALFSKDTLNIKRGEKQTVLVWGGSSCVGQFAIQLAVLNNLNVITTCSPRNFDLVKSLGASHAFDYSSINVSEDIGQAAPDLKFVFDTIGNATSSKKACERADPECTLCTVRPGKVNTDNVQKSVKITDVLVWTAFLKEHNYGKFHWDAKPEDHELASELYDSLPTWIEEGRFKPNAVRLLEGLESVPEGFQLHRDGKLSAQKIVYKV